MIHVSAVVHFPVDLPPTEMVPATHQGKWYVNIKVLLSVESINKIMDASMSNCAHMLSWLELKLDVGCFGGILYLRSPHEWIQFNLISQSVAIKILYVYSVRLTS